MLESLPSPAEHYRQACLLLELAATTTDTSEAVGFRAQARIHAILATAAPSTYSRAETIYAETLAKARARQAAEAADPSVHAGAR
jgi:hypothetical protein